ncbi:MAG: hypothetical protein V1911_01085, partial [Candidatus Micrarchaeota archaeon]
MNYMKALILALLLVSAGAALEVSIDNPLETVAVGGVAHYYVTINNDGGSKNVIVSADSELPISVTEDEFYLAAGELKDIDMFVIAGDGEGLYPIVLTVNDKDYDLALLVENGTADLVMNSVYDQVEVAAGQYQDLRFIVRNEGNERMRNILVRGDIPTSMDPEYPVEFNLDANEVKEVKVRVTVPADYPAAEYEFVLKAVTGNIKAEAETMLVVNEAPSIENALEMNALNWEAVKTDGTVTGYKITFKVINRAIADITGVSWTFEGMPEDWAVSGSDKFDIAGYET